MTIRPRLAPAFTIAQGDGVVWLVAGEDVRYRLGVADPAWLAAVLARCDGRATLAEILAHAPANQRGDAEATILRLYEERVVLDGTAAQARAASPARFRVTGLGALADRLRGDPDLPGEPAIDPTGGTPAPLAEPAGSPPPDDLASSIDVLAQDRLDHAALLAHNAAALAARRPWLWATTGPGGRAYVGPLFVPGAGPCAACLLLHFKRLSPVPELYDALLAHGAAGNAIAPTPFPDGALAVTAALVRWKLGLAADPVAAPALYALHVVEVADLTVTSHEPLADPECAACRP